MLVLLMPVLLALRSAPAPLTWRRLPVLAPAPLPVPPLPLGFAFLAPPLPLPVGLPSCTVIEQLDPVVTLEAVVRASLGYYLLRCKHW